MDLVHRVRKHGVTQWGPWYPWNTTDNEDLQAITNAVTVLLTVCDGDLKRVVFTWHSDTKVWLYEFKEA